jgi:hypothetical protein
VKGRDAVRVVRRGRRGRRRGIERSIAFHSRKKKMSGIGREGGRGKKRREE